MAQKKKTKEEIERERSIGRIALEFAQLVCRAKPGAITPFHIEEGYMQPSFSHNEPSEQRFVILTGVFVGEQRFGGGVIALDERTRELAPCMSTSDLAQLVRRWREEPYSGPPAGFGLETVGCSLHAALLRALSRLDDQIAERQDAGDWPRPKAAS